VVATGGEGGDVFELGDQSGCGLCLWLSGLVDGFGEADVAVGALGV
jgi:hypothetical protein